jgi:hypothetical protein
MRVVSKDMGGSAVNVLSGHTIQQELNDKGNIAAITFHNDKRDQELETLSSQTSSSEDSRSGFAFSVVDPLMTR